MTVGSGWTEFKGQLLTVVSAQDRGLEYAGKSMIKRGWTWSECIEKPDVSYSSLLLNLQTDDQATADRERIQRSLSRVREQYLL